MDFHSLLIDVKQLDFYRSKNEKEQFKINKKFPNFKPQPCREYTDNYERQNEDWLEEGTLIYEILKMDFKLKRLKRAKYIIEKFNKKERKTDIQLRIDKDRNTGRFHLRFGHKNMRTLEQLDV